MISTGNFTYQRWCTGCNAEPATHVVEAQINGEWTEIDLGKSCLTRLDEDGKIEEK